MSGHFDRLNRRYASESVVQITDSIDSFFLNQSDGKFQFFNGNAFCAILSLSTSLACEVFLKAERCLFLFVYRTGWTE